MKLETKRLILRKPRPSDWKDIVEMAGDKDFSKMLSGVPYPYRKKDADELIKKWMKKEKINHYFFIELKSKNKVIGTLHLNFDDRHKVGRTASWINKKYWRKGYITEAKIVVIDFAFNKLKLRKLNSQVFVENKASNATQKKIGYKMEGKLRKAVKSKATGKIHDEYLYGLLKEDWKKARPKVIKDLKKKLK